MEDIAVEMENDKKTSSYTYWVRNATCDAAPLSLPKKLSAEDVAKQQAEQSKSVGSVWNQAGTWEERNLSSWASSRIQELLHDLGCLEFDHGKAIITEVSSCTGEATVVTVRNKKRVGYTYEISLKFKGEWLIQEERKEIEGMLKIPEVSFGDLEEIELDVLLNGAEEIAEAEKNQVVNDLKQFTTPLKGRLLRFEEELKDR